MGLKEIHVMSSYMFLWGLGLQFKMYRSGPDLPSRVHDKRTIVDNAGGAGEGEDLTEIVTNNSGGEKNRVRSDDAGQLARERWTLRRREEKGKEELGNAYPERLEEQPRDRQR
jgi:hypothetical protein